MSYIDKLSEMFANIKIDVATLERVRIELGNGADEEMWPPGKTIDQAVALLVKKVRNINKEKDEEENSKVLYEWGSPATPPHSAKYRWVEYFKKYTDTKETANVCLEYYLRGVWQVEECYTSSVMIAAIKHMAENKK